jgi:hypothetical protein
MALSRPDIFMTAAIFESLSSKFLSFIDIENATGERCLEEDESATHILCDCEAIAYLRFRHLCQFFMEPSDYYEAPINKALHFIRSV